MRALSRVCLVLALAAVAAFGQSVISARSGVIHYVEGSVYAGDQEVEGKFGNFPEMKENAVLRTTAEGRAEVLLTPGVFLRVGENSAVRMVTNRLVDTRLEFLSGSAVIEAADLPKDNSVTMVYGDYAVHLDRAGLYRLDSEPAALHVFEGRATVRCGDESMEVKKGRVLAFRMPLATAKFDREGYDALDRWSRNRGAVLAMANVSSARSLSRSGFLMSAGGWAWNPYFGMYTFMPMRGAFLSPYGYRYWSPATVGWLYQPGLRNPGRGPGWSGSPGGGGSPMRPGDGGAAGRMAAQPARDPSSAGASGVPGMSSPGGGGQGAAAGGARSESAAPMGGRGR